MHKVVLKVDRDVIRALPDIFRSYIIMTYITYPVTYNNLKVCDESALQSKNRNKQFTTILYILVLHVPVCV